MVDSDEFEDFEDEVIDNNLEQVQLLATRHFQNLTFNAESLLKAPISDIKRKSSFVVFVESNEIDNESMMKTEIQDLIDQSDNKDVVFQGGSNLQIINVLTFIKDYADDKNSWRTFASYLKSSPLEFARKGFNIIFNRFPCSGSFVRMYCEMEEAKGHSDIVVEVSFMNFCSIDFEKVSSLLRKY